MSHRPAILRLTLLGTRALLRALATRAGYPAAGVRVGGGRHVEDPADGGPFKTRRACRAVKHPTLTRYAILRSAQLDPLLTAEGVVLATETVDLDADPVAGAWPAAVDEDPTAD